MLQTAENAARRKIPHLHAAVIPSTKAPSTCTQMYRKIRVLTYKTWLMLNSLPFIYKIVIGIKNTLI